MRETHFFLESIQRSVEARTCDAFSLACPCGGIALQYTDELSMERNMKILKSLTFGVMSRGSQNPVLARRAKLIHRLEQQKRLAQDANFVVTVSRWLRNEAGSKEFVNCKSGSAHGGARTCSGRSG